MGKTQEDIIINHIQIVTNGIIKNIRHNNSYASWKNIPQRLDLIKTHKQNFYLGVNIWLNITQKQLLGSENNEFLEKQKNKHPWMNSIFEIKKIINLREI